MNVVAEPTLVSSKVSSPRRWAHTSLLIFAALLWIEVIRHLKGEWSFNPQYGYGWSVPFLALYLLSRRWPTRPRPNRVARRGLVNSLIIFCGALLLPVCFVAEANPDWRLLSWAFAFLAVTISLLTCYLSGGGASLRHFAFPIAFFLVAVPWPVQLEQFVIQHLMRAVSAINVVLINLVGIPAVQHGNVIEVASGLIGVEEACSGVRSLQATLMLSLFLGELFNFRSAFRFLLVAAGATVAFICNLFRTALLVWVGARKGVHAIEGWHDPAGLTILLICLAALWGCSLAIQRFLSGSEIANKGRQGMAISRSSPNGGVRGWGAPARSTIETGGKPTTIFNLNAPLFTGMALWLVVIEIMIQGWYALHQAPWSKPGWTVQWPTSERDYKPVSVAPAAIGLLRYDEGGAASWQARDNHVWMLFSFRWLPGHTAAN